MTQISPVPGSIGDISAGWLSRVLHDAGVSPPEAIRAIDVTPNPVWNVAETAFVAAELNDAAPADTPRRFFIKVRQVPDHMEHLFPGEHAFYAGRRDVRLPLATCYAALREEETGATCLVLADMRDTHVESPWPLPPTEPRCRGAMEALAGIHAQGWMVGDAQADRAAFIERESLLQEHIEGLLPGVLDGLGDLLSKARRETLETAVSHVLALKTARLSGTAPICAIHGDAHFWNLLYPRDPARDRCVVIDWEDWRVDFAASDLALAMAMHWYPERRARLEEPMLRHYLEVVKTAGVTGYSWDDLSRDYRIAHLCNVIVPVFQCDAGQSHASWWSNLERWFLAFDDLGCSELL
jgi:hypothetical protein